MINVKTKYMKFQFFRVNKKVVMLSRKTILEANLVFARRPQLEFATIGVTTLQSHDSCCSQRFPQSGEENFEVEAQLALTWKHLR